MPEARVFIDRSIALDSVLASISSSLAPNIALAIGRLALNEFEDPSQPMSRDLVVRRWVLRPEDLRVLRQVTDAAVSASAADLLFNSRTIAVFVGLVVAVFRATRAINAKGVVLDDDALAVLLVLKKHDGATTHELLASSSLTPQALSRTLRVLGAIALKDGTVVALAQQDGNGRWHTAV